MPAPSSWTLGRVLVAVQTLLPTSPGAAVTCVGRLTGMESSLPTCVSSVLPRCPEARRPPVAFLSICGHFILVNTLFFLWRKYWCQFHPQLKDKSEPCPAQGPEGKHHRRETDIDFFAWRQKNKCVILNLHCK